MKKCVTLRPAPRTLNGPATCGSTNRQQKNQSKSYENTFLNYPCPLSRDPLSRTFWRCSECQRLLARINYKTVQGRRAGRHRYREKRNPHGRKRCLRHGERGEANSEKG